MKFFITGGTGFLGCHIARHLLNEGAEVRVLDLLPLDEPDLKGKIEVHIGDVQDGELVNRLCNGIDVVIHTAAALPIRGSRKAILAVNIDGTRNVMEGALRNSVRKVIFISTTAVYGIPKIHPLYETSAIIPLGHYGESKVAAERVCMDYQKKGLDITIIRPKTFIGKGRLGVFQILFEWIRCGYRIFIIGNGKNRYQLLAVEDLVDSIWRTSTLPNRNAIYNIGAKEFKTVREEMQALIAHAGSSSKVTPLPAKPVQLTLRALELTRLSPLVEWHYKTASQDSFVDVSKAEQELDWHPQKSNLDTLTETYDWYINHYQDYLNKVGITHRVAWNQKILKFFRWKS